MRAKKSKEKELYKDTIAHFIDEHIIGIRLYNIGIITMDRFNIYKFNMLFPTSTALDIFNKYTPAKIILKDLKFYVLRDVSKGARRENLIPFYSGITVDKEGNVYSAIT